MHWINGHCNLLTLHLIDFFMKLFKTTNVEVVLGLPTVQDSPGQSGNWPTVSRVPGR